MPEIVLTTLNARYAHTSFGLRYLRANLGPLRERSVLAEFEINQRPLDVAERLLALKPRVIGLGVYIWNLEPATQLVRLLKRIAPDVVVVLGGPEVSYETDEQAIGREADHVIQGEGEVAFRELCEQLLRGERPGQRIIAAALPDVEQITLPYDEYTDEDLAQRVVYVEASRGCPFRCEFCLSSLDIPVRNFPLGAFLAGMQRLLDRGLRQFKFVDRTFNLNVEISRAVLQFFLDRYEPGMFLHFEMIPDRVPDALREVIAAFPGGALQFEVGIQSFNDAVTARISRRQDGEVAARNIRWLREQTGVHLHADLIVGLPGEAVESIAAGFDRLIGLGVQEIQMGMLKRLRGAPIVRHDDEWRMVYSPDPPYEILRNRHIDFTMMQRLRRLARYWDLVGNSGNFTRTRNWLWRDGKPFDAFLAFSDWLYEQTGRTHAIALARLCELVFEYLTQMRGCDGHAVASDMAADWRGGGRRGLPQCVQPYVSHVEARMGLEAGPRRQARHRS